MKPYYSTNRRALLWCACLACLLAGALDSIGAPTNAPTVAVEAGLRAGETVFPKSEFNERGGKDPFFPYRVLNPIIKPNDVQPNEAARFLVLNGISGTASRPLAIINGYTFAISDAADVTTTAGKLKIRCLEIRKDSVVVEIINSDERKELHLRGRP